MKSPSNAHGVGWLNVINAEYLIRPTSVSSKTPSPKDGRLDVKEGREQGSRHDDDEHDHYITEKEEHCIVAVAIIPPSMERLVTDYVCAGLQIVRFVA